MSTELVSNNKPIFDPEILEKVILQNDLGGLKPIEKVQHIKSICESLKLNPLTRPIQLIKFQGKEICYMSKDGAEQLRFLHNVSITKMETEIMNGDLYVVRAYAQLPNGRQDCSTSAQSIKGLHGEAIGNAMKKCETQAKRRVTLSICGLGMLDESELIDLPKEKTIFTPQLDQPRKIVAAVKIPDEAVDIMIDEINSCESESDLKNTFIEITKNKNLKADRESLQKVIDAKDRKKHELDRKDTDAFLSEFDDNTGEIK